MPGYPCCCGCSVCKIETFQATIRNFDGFACSPCNVTTLMDFQDAGGVPVLCRWRSEVIPSCGGGSAGRVTMTLQIDAGTGNWIITAELSLGGGNLVAYEKTIPFQPCGDIHEIFDSGDLVEDSLDPICALSGDEEIEFQLPP